MVQTALRSRATRRISAISILTLSLLASASNAHALEGKALFEKLMTQAPGTSLSYDSLTETSADSFTMQGVTLTKDGSTQLMKWGSVTFKGFREAEEGRIVYDAFAITDVEASGTKPGVTTVDAISSTNGDIPFEALKAKVPEQYKSQRLKLGNFTVSGVKASGLSDGAEVAMEAFSIVNADIPLDYRWDGKPNDAPVASPLTLDSFGMTGLSGSQNGVTWSIGSIALADLNFPTSPNVPLVEMMKVYSAVSMNDVAANLGPTEAFRMASLAGTITPPDASGVATQSSTISGIMVNLKAIPDPKMQAISQQLGYDKIEGSMTGTGSYNLSTGRGEISNLSINLKDMFDLAMKYAITGYTEEVAQQLQAVQLEIAKGTPPMQAYAAMMPALSNVKLEGLTLSLTDQSLTGRLLDFQAKQMGTTGEQLATGAPVMLGMGMVQLGMPDFTDMVTKAVGTFLKDKGTLSLTAQPSAPVAVTDIFMATQTDPKKIPELLNIQVSAQ